MIEVALDLGGYPVVLADTGGLARERRRGRGGGRAPRPRARRERRFEARADRRDAARGDATRSPTWSIATRIVIANKIDLLPPGDGAAGTALRAVGRDRRGHGRRCSSGLARKWRRGWRRAPRRSSPARAIARRSRRAARRSTRFAAARAARARRRGSARRRAGARPHHRPGRCRGHAGPAVRRILHRQIGTNHEHLGSSRSASW